MKPRKQTQITAIDVSPHEPYQALRSAVHAADVTATTCLRALGGTWQDVPFMPGTYLRTEFEEVTLPTLAARRQVARRWIVCKALTDVFEGVGLFLAECYRIGLLAGLDERELLDSSLPNAQKVPSSPQQQRVQVWAEGEARSFRHYRSLRKKIDVLRTRFGLVIPNADVLLSINGVRNCVVHHQGTAPSASDDALRLKYLHLYVVGLDAAGAAMEIRPSANDMESGTINLWESGARRLTGIGVRVEERVFEPNSVIDLNEHDLGRIVQSVVLICEATTVALTNRVREYVPQKQPSRET